MTLKQLVQTQVYYLRSFDRAVVKRRAYIKKVMAAQLKMRKAAKNPHNSTTKAARSQKAKMYNALYRSIMNKAGNSKCARWTRDKKGNWGCGGCNSTPKMKRRCRA